MWSALFGTKPHLLLFSVHPGDGVPRREPNIALSPPLTPQKIMLPGSFESKWEVMHPLGQCLVMVYLEPSIMEALPSILPFGREVSCLSPL